VIGPPGSGKTNVLTALHDALADSDVAHAVIELEAVAWAHHVSRTSSHFGTWRASAVRITPPGARGSSSVPLLPQPTTSPPSSQQSRPTIISSFGLKPNRRDCCPKGLDDQV